jgi:hypothetical protein
MFILLDFVFSVNDSAVAAGEEDERYYHWLLAATCGCYLAAIALVGAPLLCETRACECCRPFFQWTV